MTSMEIILVTLVAAICGMGSVLDERQTHRPLVACTLIGLVLGDLKTGVLVGGTLELVAIGWMNVGAAMAPDAALASVVASILVIKGGQDPTSAIGPAVAVAGAGQVLTIFVRTATIFLQHKADEFAKNANFRGIELMHFTGLALQALRVAVPTFFVALFAEGEAVKNFFESVPEVITTGLQISGGFVVIVGFAMVINMMRAGALMPFFFLGFVIAAYSSYNLVALGILGTCLAFIYIQLNPQFNAQAQVATTKRKLADNELEGL